MEQAAICQRLLGGAVQTVPLGDGCTVCRMAGGQGSAVLTSHALFPGVTLVYHDVHRPSCAMELKTDGEVLEICHCTEGRMECQFGDTFYYLTPGDTAIARRRCAAQDVYYPISHYHGLSVLIDCARAPECLSCVLSDVAVRPAELAARFCGDSDCCVLRANARLTRVFSDLCDVPERIRLGYFKVKALELLLVLGGMDAEPAAASGRVVPRRQVELAKRVCQHLSMHMHTHITIDALARQFHISQTQIKQSFKAVYGVSVYSFIRAQKMQAAALLLRHTDETVLEIAGRFGYENGSKFAAAFRDEIGMTPAQFRAADRMGQLEHGYYLGKTEKFSQFLPEWSGKSCLDAV